MKNTQLTQHLPILLILLAFASSLSFVPPALAASTVVVSPANMDDWAFQVTSADGVGDFAVGPDKLSLGVGSVYLFTGTHGDESAQIRNTAYAGTSLSSLTELTYRTYATQWNGQQVPYIILNIDFTGDAVMDDLLFFEPAYQTPTSGNPNLPDQGAVALNMWQTWNALVGGWWSLNGIADANPGTGVKPLSDYLAAQPNAQIVNSDNGLGGVRLVVGFASASDIFEAYSDAFKIGIAGAEAITYNFEPVVSITVNADSGANLPLHVDIKWQNATHSGTSTTSFQLTGQIGDTMLEAPSTHIEGSTFYIFSSWSYDETKTKDRIITISGETTATAHYAAAVTVNKVLTECYTILDTGEEVACNPKQVPIGTVVYFTMRITIHAYTPVTAAMVKDGIGADLVLDDYVPSSGDVVTQKAGKGKMGATKVTWTIGDPEVSVDYTLDLYVHTGLNPQRKQEYTSPGIQYLNSGPELSFMYEGVEYVVQGPAVAVNVLAPSEP